MRKKLIAAIIVLLCLVAAAVGVIIFMESKPGESSGSENAVTDFETQDPVETTEETVGLSLPTEDPGEVAPEDSFDEDAFLPPATGSSGNSGETESPDANETPEDIF